MSSTIGQTSVATNNIIPTSIISSSLSSIPLPTGNVSSIITAGNVSSIIASVTTVFTCPTTTNSPETTSTDHGIYDTGYGQTYVKNAMNAASVGTQFTICFVIGLIIFLAFCVFRTRIPVLFAPRDSMKRHKPPELPNTLFGWILPLLKISDEDMLDNVGLDALLMLKFILMCLKIFAVCCFFGLVVFFPITLTSHFEKTKNNTSIDRLSIAVLETESESHKYIAYLIFSYIFTFITFFFLTKSYDEYVYLRAKFLLKQSKTMVARSIIVTGIPSYLRSDQALSDYFEKLNIGPVESCYVVREVHRLNTLIKKRANALICLEEAYASYWGNPCKIPGYDPDRILDDVEMYKKVLNLAEKRESTDNDSSDEEHKQSGTTPSSSIRRNKRRKPGNTTFFKGLVEPKFNAKKTVSRRPTVRIGGFFGLFGKKVDAIEYYTKLFDDLDKTVVERRRSPNYEITNVAFVTFEQMSSAVIASQIAINPAPFTCRTSMACEPRDVLWESLQVRGRGRVFREIVIWTITVALVIFWVIPIFALCTMISSDFIAKFNPGLAKRIDDSEIGTLILSSFIPTIIINICTSVLPLFFDAMGYYQGLRSRSAIAESTLSKYYFFLIVFVLIIYTLITTSINTIQKQFSNLETIPTFIAKSLSQFAPFFINYTILQGFLIMPLNLLLLGAIFIRGFWHIFICSTPREHAENRAPWAFNYGIGYPAPLLVFGIVFEYSLINPLILLFGVVYFCFTYVVYKYQFLYVYFRPYEAAGKLWLMTIPRIVFTLILFQLTMMGIFLLNGSFVVGGLCVPLIFITVLYKFILDKAYSDNGRNMPMQLLSDSLNKLPNDSDIEDGDDDDDSDDSCCEDHQKRDNTSSVAKNDSNEKTPTSESAQALEQRTIARNRWKKAALTATMTAANLNAVQPSTEITTTDSKSTILRPRHKKLVLDEDDYEATPTRYTDYRQPPMQLNPGILDAGLRKYGNPLLVGILPQLWLPVKIPVEGESQSQTGRRRSDILHGRTSGGGNLAQHLAEILRKVEHENKSESGNRAASGATNNGPQQPMETHTEDESEAALIAKSRTFAHNDAASIVEGTPHPKITALRTLFKRGVIKQSNVPNKSTSAQDLHMRPIQHTTDDVTMDSIERGQHGTSVDHSSENSSSRSVHKVYYHHPERRKSHALSYEFLAPPRPEHKSSNLSSPALFPDNEDDRAIAESIIRPDTQNSRRSSAPLLNNNDKIEES